jgi:hypothetical protein
MTTAATSGLRETRKLACTVSRVGRITWLCDVCGQPIKAKTGYVTVDDGKALRQYGDAEEREFRREVEARANGQIAFIELTEMLSWPDSVKWQALHHDCDPDPERGDYWFGVERVDTLARLLDWAAHLSEKNWIAQTDWDDLLRTVAAAAGGADA